jgi:ABC-type transporter Mla subunit MlaD
MVTMLNVSQRANRVPPEASENANEKSVTEVEGALREFARDVGPMRRDPKDATDFVANVDLLAQRSASLVELRSVIRELQQLHDFLQSEGERLQREISEYAQLSKATTNSTRLIADNMTNWKKAAKESPI